MTPLAHIVTYLREKKICGFFSVALLAPERGSTLAVTKVETKAVDPVFDFPDESRKLKKLPPKEKQEKRARFEQLMIEATASGFSFTNLLEMAPRKIPIVIFDKTLQNDPRCPVTPDENIFVYFLEREEFTPDSPELAEFWARLCSELEIENYTPPINDIVKNFNNVLIKPRSELLQQCVLLLPAIPPKNLADERIRTDSDKKYNIISSDDDMGYGLPKGVAGRFVGLLNVTCRLPSNFNGTADLIQALEVPQLLTASRLARKFMTSYDEAATTAARAAVFARNFSHVIGSHVISNPDFREALARPTTVEAKGPGTKPTHLLENLRTFHEYLQGRFDFIARAIDESHDQPEPVYFVSDLLEGFLKQSAFLDTFVADLGVRLADISITIRLPGDGDNEPATFKTSWKTKGSGDRGNLERQFWAPQDTDKSVMAYDQLVGIPGGMVSAHAFYSILENIVRNSVKYGKAHRNNGKKEPYALTLSVENCGSIPHTWKIRASDNYSTVTKKELDDIRRRIEPSFVHPNGAARRDSLGLLEMQACASGLYRPPPERRTPNARGNLSAVSAIELAPDAGESSAPLVYELNLSKPVLLAIVGKKDPNHRSDSIRYFSSLKELIDSGRGAHIVAIDIGKWPHDTDHQLLPYRLLAFDKDTLRGAALPSRRVMVVDDASLRTRLFATTEVAALAGASHGDFEKDLILDCYEAWLRQWKSSNKDGHQWDLWIGMDRTDKQVEDMWREPLEEFSKRGRPSDFVADASENSRKPPLVNIAVRAQTKTLFTSDHPYNQVYWDRELKAGHCDKKALLFDNHAKCFTDAIAAEKSSDYRRATRFYQKTNGYETPELFRMLSHPPSSPFAFAFLVFSLVEACLATVVIVDERIAADLLFSDDNTTDEQDHFVSKLGQHHKSGVFPTFGFGRNMSAPVYYTPAHQLIVDERVRKSAGTSDPHATLSSEGIRFDLGGIAAPSLKLLATREWDDDSLSYRKYDLITAATSESDASDHLRCDVIVIHEGVLDLLGKQVNWPRGYEQQQKIIQSLWKLSPLVVRTSGRGRHTKHFPHEVPFVEFSEISSSLLTARNKLTLVRSLLGASGERASQS